MRVANEDLAANSRGAACAAVARSLDLSRLRQLLLVVRGVLACCCTDADNASTCTVAKLDLFVFVTFPLHIFSRFFDPIMELFPNVTDLACILDALLA